jgi:hypothetical protein
MQCFNVARKSPCFETYFPFISDRLVSRAMKYSSAQLFDSVNTRKPFRDDMRACYGGEITLRKDKGHLTGIYQRAIKSRMGELRDIIRGGVLSMAGLIDVHKVETAMARSAQGYGGVPVQLLKILCFELNVYQICRTKN